MDDLQNKRKTFSKSEIPNDKLSKFEVVHPRSEANKKIALEETCQMDKVKLEDVKSNHTEAPSPITTQTRSLENQNLLLN